MNLNWRKIKGFLFKYRISLAIVFVVIIAAAGTTWYLLGRNISFTAPSLTLVPPKETRVEAPLTGVLVDPVLAAKRAFAVVIENHPDARPQSGYNDADIVYETLAEGGITRTLAIFQSKEPKEIGPVRSARMYFIDWLSEHNAIFSHVGGNADALADIANKKIPDLNQFAWGDYYWRSTARYAPHNVYTTIEKLRAAATKAGYDLGLAPKPYKFKDEAKEAERPATGNITIEFSGPLFTAGYAYDTKTNSYFRKTAGVVHKDANDGAQLHPKNVIVQYTSITATTSSAGEQAMAINTIGSGKSIIFQDGKAVVGTWSKASRAARTIFADSTGKEIELNRGQTWISVVPLAASVTY